LSILIRFLPENVGNGGSSSCSVADFLLLKSAKKNAALYVLMNNAVKHHWIIKVNVHKFFTSLPYYSGLGAIYI